jgi:GYF domain 2
MGIKFHCPNGHKLNVKAFLAGKKGVCPKCGTKFRIPAESEPGLDSDLEEGDAGASGIKSGNGSPAANRPQIPVAAAVPGAARSHAEGVPVAAVAASPSKPTPSAPPAHGAASADPIAEAPQAVWYVRPPTGGQFGPARGDLMRTWLGEGRVTSDSLVWREGWTDWQSAGKIFPTLEPAALEPPTTPAPLAGLSAAVVPRSAIRPAAKKKGASGTAIAILVGLALVCLSLVAVLAYVLLTVK